MKNDGGKRGGRDRPGKDGASSGAQLYGERGERESKNERVKEAGVNS